MVLAIYDLQATPILLIKFRVNWPFGPGENIQNKFSSWRPWRPCWIFYLQVISIISFKFQVNLLFSSGEEFQNLFFFRIAAVAAILIFWSKWFSYFYLQVALILPTRFRVNWPFRSGEENNFKGGAKAAILDFRLKWYLLFFIYKSPRYLLTSFESVGFPFRWRIQNRLSRWRLCGQLGFSIWRILASFLSTSYLDTSNEVSSQLAFPLKRRISDGSDFSYFWSTSHPDTSYQVLS